MAEFDQQAYINAYNKQKYDSITIRLPTDHKDQIKAKAAAHGLSIAAYIWMLVREDKINE